MDVAGRLIDLSISFVVVAFAVIVLGMLWELAQRFLRARPNQRLRRRIRREVQAFRDRRTVDVIAQETVDTITILCREVNEPLKRDAA